MGASELKEEPLSKSKFILKVRVLGGVDFHYTFHQLVADIEREMSTHLCSECGKSFSEAANLFIHQTRTHDNTQYSHLGERPDQKEFACEECKFTTMTKAYLKDHIRRMHLVRGVGWMCVGGTCENKPKTFVNNRLLLQHKKDHQNLPCPSCIKTFTSKRNLNRHIKVVHKKQQNIDRRSQEDSLSFVPAHQAVSVEELLNLTTFDLEGAIVLPLDPLIN